jgi:hypothetical protein
MGDPTANPDKKAADAAISYYIQQWEQRLPQFKRDHESELRETSRDAFGRFLQEHLLYRGKSTYDSVLQSMLTPAERDLLHTDPTFTQAWQIFVDLCWLRKRVKMVATLVVIILICFALAGVFVWSMPTVIGPKTR